MQPPLEQSCYSCRILLHSNCEEKVTYLGTEGPCLCQASDHGDVRFLLRDYEDLSPIPERVGHKNNEPVKWENVIAAYGVLTRSLDAYNRGLPPGERVHIPFALQEVLADYIEERKAIESIVPPATHDA